MVENKTPHQGRFSWAGLLVVFGVLAFVGAWLAPNHYPPWLSFHGESLMFFALMAFCGVLLLKRRPICIDGMPLLVGLLMGLIWLQWAAGQIAYSGDAAVSCLYLTGFCLAWCLGFNAARDSESERITQSLKWLSTMLVVAAAASCFIALLQWLRMESMLGIFSAEKEPGGRPFGNLAQPNHLATLILMGLVMSATLFYLQAIRRWQYLTLVGYFSFGLIATESRAGWISAGVLGLFFFWRAQRNWGLGDGKTIASWWAGLALLGVGWKPLNEALLLHSTRPLESLTQDNARLTMWRQMLAGIEQSPWWGYGWRQTVVGHKVGANTVPGDLPTDYGHNLVLDLFMWVGIPLGLLLLLLAGVWLVKAAKRINEPTQFLLLATSLPLGVHSMFEYPFAYAYFLFPIAWLIGALSALQRQRLPVPVPRIVAAGVVLVFSVLCAWVMIEYAEAEEDYRVMRFELRNLGQRPPGHEAPKLVLVNQLGEMLALARLVPSRDMTAQQLDRMRVANASFTWATLQLRYAIALGLNGQPKEATRQMESLRALYGSKSYHDAASAFQALEREKYPELGLVKLP